MIQTLGKGSILQGGKYKIVRFISSGGFGCTYEAEHVMLEQRVAIKEFFVKDFCNRDEATSHVTVGTLGKKGLVEKMRRKFIDEAKGLCKLSHPGIVRVSDVFEENGTAYYVMDYIDGCSLGDMVKKSGALPEKQALKYIREVAAALDYVHQNNRLHLDVKPGNVMIDSRDRAVLIDFGASKQYDEEGGENTSTLMGMTPGYAPLEQIGNDLVKFTPSTDIYSLAAMLYKLVTGITPIGANLLASGEKLAPLPAHIGAGTRHVLNTCIQTNRGKRAQSIAEFLQMLDNPPAMADTSVTQTAETDDNEETVMTLKEEEEEWVPETPKKGGKQWMLFGGVGLVAVLLVALVAVWMSGDEKQPASEPEPTTDVAETQVVKAEAEDVKALSASKDVKDMAFTNRMKVSFTYSGAVNAQSEPHGFGSGVYESGTYIGQYRAGLREGNGKFTFSDVNEYFDGVFANDMFDSGRYVFEDGTYFEGTFKDWMPHDGKTYDKQGKLLNVLKNGKIS